MLKKNKKSTQVVLLILDGWGLGKKDASNPIYLAETPFIDSLYQKYPWIKICAAGKCAGLPKGQVGNSEAGHENIGAGRVVNQEVVKISRQINTGEFFKNSAFLAAANHTKKNKSAMHIMGMLSNGQSPHSDPDHLMALLLFCRHQKVKKIFLHLFTDGRDSPPRSSLKVVEAIERSLRPNELVATIIGRFYAMDRKKAWKRTFRAYNAMILGNGHQAKSPQEGITHAYNDNIADEYIEPIILYHKNKMVPRIKDKDAIIFFNLRSDRARQMAKPFVQDEFREMNPKAPKRKKILKDILFVAMTDFGPDLDGILTAYPSEDLKDTLPALLEEKKQIYIAESEKYAHITYFFNGGYANPINGEDRLLVASPNVDSYDRTPSMATAKITQKIITSLKKYDFICANIACPDMIGHTGNFKAGIKAAQAVDKYVKKITQAVLKENGALIITADHGNLEYMKNLKTGEIVTEHTANLVPFILVGNKFTKNKRIKGRGMLGNVAPVVLDLFSLKARGDMRKKSLL